ncbi:MAG: hypothetical protein ACRDRB_09785 [Pseudonocardiaceae bacterium]
MAYTVPLDIYNRALQNCGRKRIWNTDEPSDAKEINACYDSLRLDELERNLWTFATRRVILRPIGIDSVVWSKPLWVSGANYSVGAVVAYTPVGGPYSGVLTDWKLGAAKTGATTPPDLDGDWHVYTGAAVIDLYDRTVPYQAGEVVLVPAAYDALVTYSINHVVNDGGSWYVSLIDGNTGNTPSASAADWVLWTGIGRGRGDFGMTATKSPIPLIYPGTVSVYISLYNGNADNPTNATVNWLSVGGTIGPFVPLWPVGAGPAHDIATSNAYRLPQGFLRQAPTNPREGARAFLGANSGSSPEDYVIEGKYLVTQATGPLMLRFVADVIDVDEFHSMFAEGLAARIANEVGPSLIEDKRLVPMMGRIAREYTRKISQARAVNAIEVGSVTLPENRYVTVRY